MLIKRHQKKKKTSCERCSSKKYVHKWKEKRTFTWWKPFYVHALFCSCWINISTPFPIINYCSSIVNCFCYYPEVMLIKFQNLYTPTNHSNFRNFNEDDRKRQKFNNNKYQLVFLITVMLIKYLHQGYTKQFDIRNVNVNDKNDSNV